MAAAATAQADNARPEADPVITRDGDQLTLDASDSTDSDGAVVGVDWYIERADGTEEVLSGTRASVTIPADEAVSVTAVVTDDQGKEDFATTVFPAS